LTHDINRRSAVPVIKTRRLAMNNTISIWQDLEEQRAELAACHLTRKQRRDTKRRIEALLAEAERQRREGA
jgi:hypothetical protein